MLVFILASSLRLNLPTVQLNPGALGSSFPSIEPHPPILKLDIQVTVP